MSTETIIHSTPNTALITDTNLFGMGIEFSGSRVNAPGGVIYTGSFVINLPTGTEYFGGSVQMLGPGELAQNGVSDGLTLKILNETGGNSSAFTLVGGGVVLHSGGPSGKPHSNLNITPTFAAIRQSSAGPEGSEVEGDTRSGVDLSGGQVVERGETFTNGEWI